MLAPIVASIAVSTKNKVTIMKDSDLLESVFLKVLLERKIPPKQYTKMAKVDRYNIVSEILTRVDNLKDNDND